ncbi:MAG: hypothetical protein HY079_13825, partial [Elusimicrobia bacterium]|nr:hypothetical protein [Elusimicrobiota bacterium]
MSSRAFLKGFVKSVLVHRHAFVSSPSRTVDIGLQASLPSAFDEAFDGPVPRAVDEAFKARRWSVAQERLADWHEREPHRPGPRLLSALLKLWSAPGEEVRPDRLEGLIDRYCSRDGLRALERLVRDFPRWSPARLWLALAYLRRTDLPAAWRELDLLCAARPRWSVPFLVRSELARVDIVYDRALDDLDRAEALDPGNAWAAAFRARVLFQSAPGPDATAAMDRAVALSPKEGWLRAWR